MEKKLMGEHYQVSSHLEHSAKKCSANNKNLRALYNDQS